MSSRLFTRDAIAVAQEVQAIYRKIFPGSDGNFVRQAFDWATDCFHGRFADYQPVDTRYHDFEHTLQGTLCMARILYGRHGAGAKPELTEKSSELGLLAILLHDTGYLKKRDDTQGTGAKYTAIHVSRSVEFAAKLLANKKFDREDIRAIQNMIRCTGIDAVLDKIPFQSELEKIMGFALGTADLAGQMAAEDYVEKLPVLYAEFEEAADYNKGQGNFKVMFSSAEDLMEKTPQFWEKFVRVKLENDFGGIYRFLNSPYPDGPNFYLDRIEANIRQLKEQLAAKRAAPVKV